jgi:intracellular septation protein
MNLSSVEAAKRIPAIAKTLIDLGPLILFFVVDQLTDIFVATGVLIVAVAAAFIVSWLMTRQIPILPSVTLCFVLIFGGLTLLLGDEEFIKIEVTLTNALCGAFLLGGLAMGKSLLKIAFGEMTDINDEGWRKLTLRMGVFLMAIAALNEVVRQVVSTDAWVAFRVYGILLLTIVFFLSQTPLIMRHWVEDEIAEADRLSN